MYYTIENYILNKFEKTNRQFSFQAKNLSEYNEWKVNLTQKLIELIGLDKMEKCDANPKVLSMEEMDGYTRTKMLIQTEPDVFMPFYILKPNNSDEKMLPCIIACHGHCSNAKDAVVNIDYGMDNIRESIESYNYSYGEKLVKEGFIVFAPDARGFGERREKYYQGDDFDKRTSSSCSYLSALAIPLGMSVVGMMIWDLMRLLDYIQTLDNITSIGACGLSGGGMQTLWLCALDERIKAAVVSGYFYGFKESLLEMHNCDCNYVPDLYRFVDVGDIGALISNRHLFIESGSDDHLNGKSGLSNIYPYIEIVKKAAAICNMENNITHNVIACGHRWGGENSIPWLVKQLANQA